MGPNEVMDKGFKAAAATTQFHCVKLSAVDKVTPSTVAGERVFGVAQETATADDATNNRVINVRSLGITRVVVATNATLALQDLVRSNGDGTVTSLAAATANQNVVGMAMVAITSAPAGSQIDMLLTPGVRAST